jgi:hypothetical protein
MYNRYKNVSIKGFGIAINEDILKNDFVEILQTGTYIHKSLAHNFDYNRKKIGESYGRELDYTADKYLNKVTAIFNKYFESPETTDLWKELPDNATFGIEYETHAGKIPLVKCHKNGLIPVKDGSLRRDDGAMSFEYATIILNKTNLFPVLKSADNLLNRYCTRNINESLHVHIGGYPRCKDMLISIYKIMICIQDELYSMFPLFIKNTGIFKKSQKSYCSPLPNINCTDDDASFYEIITFLSDGEININEFSFGMPHPLDENNDHKWNLLSRYYLCNFIPYVFKGNGTIEFRMHTSTFNKDKIAAWIFIISAIVEYAYKNKNATEFNADVNLNKIINTTYNNKKLKLFLNKYIQYRKDLMKLYQYKHHDFVGILDVKNDNLNKFKFPIKEIV